MFIKIAISLIVVYLLIEIYQSLILILHENESLRLERLEQDCFIELATRITPGIDILVGKEISAETRQDFEYFLSLWKKQSIPNDQVTRKLFDNWCTAVILRHEHDPDLLTKEDASKLFAILPEIDDELASRAMRILTRNDG